MPYTADYFFYTKDHRLGPWTRVVEEPDGTAPSDSSMSLSPSVGMFVSATFVPLT